ncbi:hypothetical protein, partial [Pseudomonas sp.]|uniref:hypothetical protein n=1 Tax=Pseudomonas sp. TaxID=306 RepID=UPI00299E6E2A
SRAGMLKLLDYGKPDPFGATVGRRRNLSWPVDAYRITLPKPDQDCLSLNPFEQVILSLLALGNMTSQALAEETCIPRDLVESILLRLRDRGLIDDFNNVLEASGSNAASETDTPAFVTALLFRELVSGQVLPFMPLLEQQPLRKQEQKQAAYKIRALAAGQMPPTQRDVIKVMRAMQRRAAEFGKAERTPTLHKIMIIDQPERYYLDCPIAIQKSDGEFRIADPFGNGFSLVLERAFEQLLEQDEYAAQWLGKWKASLSQPRSPSQDSRNKEPFDTPANQQRYPKLISNLRLLPNAAFRSIAQLYAAVEWSLFYACAKRPFEGEIEHLRFTPQAEHAQLLDRAASEVGLLPPGAGFRPVREGKLRDFQEGKAELETLLALSILRAQDDGSHPLRRLAARDPALISHLLEIKKARDEKGHGKGSADAPESELLAEPLAREIIEIMLPEVTFTREPTASSNPDAYADVLLDARASIQDEFGFGAFNRLGTNVKERLVHAERGFLSWREGDDALALVRDLYAAVQSVLELSLNRWLPPDMADEELIEAAQERATEFGLCHLLPKSLHTVRASVVRKTLQGSGQSLGACMIALLLMADEQTLKSIAATRPTFVDDVATLIARRGHGNEPLPLASTEVTELRKASYKIIKALIEV